MKIDIILREQQPSIYKELRKFKKENEIKREKEHLSFFDFKNMMKHSSYKRARGGALRQVSYS